MDAASELGSLTPETTAALVPAPLALAGHSRHVQRVRRVCAPYLDLLPPGVPARASIDLTITRLLAAGRSLASALRIARQLTMERLAVLDIEQQASVEVVTRGVTELAEVTLERALAAA
ncbi:MAG: glutamine-synthetase adenylyltransferase, partial [Leptothrix sp. (in: b-proteobacteria)]